MAPESRAFRRRAATVTASLVGAVTALAGCGTPSTAPPPRGSVAAHWERFTHLHGVVDLSGPRVDGSLSASAGGRLFVLRPGRAPAPFARGAGGYRAGAGDEPYIAVSPGGTAIGGSCSFRRDDVYALALGSHPGVDVVDQHGHARRFADLPGGETPKGIAFDSAGRFGRRLLVTGAAGNTTQVFALECRGRVQTLTRRAPRVEGGIVVAPLSFGRYGGQLIAPDEKSGRLVAIDQRGGTRTIGRSGLATGSDLGIESAGFLPRGFTRAGAAYLADRGVPGNAHPGTDSILILRGTALARAGVAPGDLLLAGEGGADTIAVRCRTTCTVRHIADGPRVAHAEGHIAFEPR
jgi:hypothetical protein